ncbi:ATP-binding cassette domain-containing protein [Natranaerobius thermophilus]|uniref:ATP-binding cassette domain-containing protein n=1 Tax=Natranaerobius thermophilus TaxID=375929 RepID=UPI0002DE63D8|nr:ATP-binding cassette domain-containing protein [Natranaerobius thermophilus]
MLKLVDITAYYGYIKALEDINMSIEEGEITALLGANGAGKTTILKVISGLLTPTQGEVLSGDKRLTKLSPEAIVSKGIIQVPEGRRIFPRMTVEENLIIGAYSTNKKILYVKDKTL